MGDGPILAVRGLTHRFRPLPGRKGWPRAQEEALAGVTFDLERGECLAVVGESGSGKTTLCRSLLRLLEPVGGQVLFEGSDILQMRPEELRAYRRKVQLVFQDPFGSLNPRLRAGAMLEEILRVHGLASSGESRRARVNELLRLVGLSPAHAERFPHQFSGGQRQRLGIARALSVDPEVVILDEPVSSLDLSIQAQILNLLMDLKERLGLTLILIAHDLGVVRHASDRVGVMYGGRLVELSSVEALFGGPLHPYTRGLLEAAAMAGSAEDGGSWVPLSGEEEASRGPGKGCVYRICCPHPGRDRECSVSAPELLQISVDRKVACWKAREGVEGG